MIIDDTGVSLKKHHKYYGQIQLGMFILNVKKASFAMYAPFPAPAQEINEVPGSMIIIEVAEDVLFIRKMLQAIKLAYFNNMLHTLCHRQATENKE